MTRMTDQDWADQDAAYAADCAYDAGFQLGRYGSKPAIRFGAYLSTDPDAASKAAQYSAFCQSECDGTRARWAAGQATDRERALLERVHAAQRARGIVPLPMPR
jgi:hypothetical protein